MILHFDYLMERDEITYTCNVIIDGNIESASTVLQNLIGKQAYIYYMLLCFFFWGGKHRLKLLPGFVKGELFNQTLTIHDSLNVYQMFVYLGCFILLSMENFMLSGYALI